LAHSSITHDGPPELGDHPDFSLTIGHSEAITENIEESRRKASSPGACDRRHCTRSLRSSGWLKTTTIVTALIYGNKFDPDLAELDDTHT
jgi:hypothetical protein